VKRTAKPATIARAAQRVLTDPTYQAAARRLGQAIRRDADSGALLRELEGLPAEGPR
jgi:UDP:flavonoid glycosyltransferase YjiC (YdhE family)